ncbi:MAG: hypothetical protein WCV92_03595 [Candidatus Buchananbacteria bacterium]
MSNYFFQPRHYSTSSAESTYLSLQTTPEKHQRRAGKEKTEGSDLTNLGYCQIPSDATVFPQKY